MRNATDEQWQRGMHHASQVAQFALALWLPLATYAGVSWEVLPAAVFSCCILRHLEDDELSPKEPGLGSKVLDELTGIVARHYDRRNLPPPDGTPMASR